MYEEEEVKPGGASGTRTRTGITPVDFKSAFPRTFIYIPYYTRSF